MALTDTRIRNLKASHKSRKVTDGGGLYLEIRMTGSKLWRYRYRISLKENVFAMGEYGISPAGESEYEAENRRASGRYTLAEARQERERCRGLVRQGIHPAHHRQLQRTMRLANLSNTFRAIATEWLDKKKPRWSPSHFHQVEHYLAKDAFPYIGSLPIRDVTAAHLLEIVQRVEGRGTATVAFLLRQWFSAIFRYAISTLRADGDPTTALKGAVTRPRPVHCKPLDPTDIRSFLQVLGSYGGYPTTIIALRLILLTFVRTVELRGACWTEIDFERTEWRITAERMKMKDAHVVPLSKQALDLLKELHTLTGSRSFLFPNYRNPRTCMSATTLNRALERMGFSGSGGIGFSAHGFRATASTMLNELGYRGDVIERQLAHRERNQVRAAYNRAAYMQERRAIMQAWADLLDNLLVIPLNDIMPLAAKVPDQEFAEG
jgi:integrase